MKKNYKSTWFKDSVQLMIVFILLYLLCSFTVVNKTNTEITWRTLGYNDFTIVDNLDGVKVAESNTGISYELIKGDRFYAKAIFEKNKSYISAKLASNKIDYIITHEQGHFDIAEYVTRKLNLRLNGIKDNQVADKLFNQAIVELETMQVLYDYETDHSEDHDAQKQWILRIRGLLLTTSQAKK